jgi:hypothetical protein
MVATGHIKVNKKTGYITKIQVFESPSSGKFVHTRWVDVSTNLSVGHTLRQGEKLVVGKSESNQAQFEIFNQSILEDFANKHQTVEYEEERKPKAKKQKKAQ